MVTPTTTEACALEPAPVCTVRLRLTTSGGTRTIKRFDALNSTLPGWSPNRTCGRRPSSARPLPRITISPPGIAARGLTPVICGRFLLSPQPFRPGARLLHFLCLGFHRGFGFFSFFPQAHGLINPMTVNTAKPYTPAMTSSNMIPQPRGIRSACRAGKGLTISNARNNRKPPSQPFPGSVRNQQKRQHLADDFIHHHLPGICAPKEFFRFPCRPDAYAKNASETAAKTAMAAARCSGNCPRATTTATPTKDPAVPGAMGK